MFAYARRRRGRGKGGGMVGDGGEEEGARNAAKEVIREKF